MERSLEKNTSNDLKPRDAIITQTYEAGQRKWVSWEMTAKLKGGERLKYCMLELSI